MKKYSYLWSFINLSNSGQNYDIKIQAIMSVYFFIYYFIVFLSYLYQVWGCETP